MLTLAAFAALATVVVVLGFDVPSRSPDARTAPARLRERRAAVQSRQVRKQWEADVWLLGIADRQKRFASPNRRILLSRLRGAARRYRFHIVGVRMLHPRQSAPEVIVSTHDKAHFAEVTPLILRMIDPKQPTGTDRTGWAYEGFYFEARDNSGTPFLGTFNHWRGPIPGGPEPGGGQWTTEAALYPFQHGGRASQTAS
jgi:hypothetical protein